MSFFGIDIVLFAFKTDAIESTLQSNILVFDHQMSNIDSKMAAF